MYYKVYGIYGPSGHNYSPYIGFSSINKAIQYVKDNINPNNMPVFAITEHLRKDCPPLGYMLGKTKTATLYITASLIEYKNERIFNEQEQTQPLIDSAFNTIRRLV